VASLLCITLIPSAWLIRVGYLQYQINNPEQSLSKLITDGCAADSSQMVWIEAAGFGGKVSCSEAILRSSAGDIDVAQLVIVKTKMPSFFLLETLVQCRYEAIARPGERVICSSFTDAP
jgi:hypothetical protein